MGLVNQAMTCYLNSLLQALYMTPEFRNALYKWKYVGSAEETQKSIPYQLQRLFLSLQVSAEDEYCLPWSSGLCFLVTDWGASINYVTYWGRGGGGLAKHYAA